MRGTKYIAFLIIIILLSSQVSAYYKTGRTESGIKYPFDAKAKYHSPIIFIHGVMGSHLVDEKGTEFWPGWPRQDRTKLSLKENGEDQLIKGTSIKATSPIRATYGDDVYQGFYDYMEDTLKYSYRGKEGKYGHQGRTYYDHAYDFRLNNEDQVKLLKEKVNNVLDKTKADKVILVAHSMGGYQARMFAKQNPNKVQAIIFFSVPHHGAPKAFEALTEGYNFGVPQLLVSDAEVWMIARNWPGPLQLVADEPFVIRDGTRINVEDSLTNEGVTFQMYQHIERNLLLQVMTEDEAKNKAEELKRTGLYNQELVKDMLKFRSKFNNIKLNSKIRLELINGENQETVHEFEVKKETPPIKYLKGFIPGERSVRPDYGFFDAPFEVWRYEAKTEPKGDKTVFFEGLQWDQADRTQTVTEEHGSVPANINALVLMKEIIEEINHDTRDGQYEAWMKTATRDILENVADYQTANIEAENLADRVKKTEDEEKKSVWEQDLQGRAKRMVANRMATGKMNRIQITIPNAGGYEDEDDFKAWMVIDDFKIVDSGIGEIKPKAIEVVVEDVETLMALGQGGRFGDYYESGKIKFKDRSLVLNFVSAVTRLVAKYLAD